jgi:23S rRNA pseudouridine1911/1915/1917 synthase
MIPADRLRSFTADRGDARLRLDQVLVRRLSDLPHVSRTAAQQWIAGGSVAVDGRPARRASQHVAAGAVVDVRLPETVRTRTLPTPEAIEVSLLYEDSWLLAVNKPAGLVVHPAYKHSSGTLLNALLWRLGPGARPGIVNRLDRQTSGVMLVARTPEVHAALQHEAACGRVRKEYLAVVTGRPRRRHGTIALPLARSPRDRRRVVVDVAGRPAETRYEVLATSANASLLRCELVTGRTHQIRVHLAARGWPIVGDALYGTPSVELDRQALHAWRISLTHPFTGAPLLVTAPLPPDLLRVVSSLSVQRDARPGMNR